MSNIRETIHFNATIKSNEFATTKLSGLAFLKAGLLIIDELDNVETCQTLNSFPHYIIPSDTEVSAILSSEILDRMIGVTEKRFPIIIGCRDQQWSYVLFVLTVLNIGSPSNYEAVVLALKKIIETEKMESISNDTQQRIARIMANHSVFQRYDDRIALADESVDEDINRLVKQEYDRNLLMLSLVLELDSLATNTLPSTETPFIPVRNERNEEDYIRPPIPPRVDRLVDHNNSWVNRELDNRIVDLMNEAQLEPIDPGTPMADTSGKKQKPMPKPGADCLKITSYAGYEPVPDEEEFRDEITTIRELEQKVREVKSLMCGRRYNEAYSQNLLQSGMTPEEVFCLLTLEV